MNRNDLARGNIDSENMKSGIGLLSFEVAAISIGLGAWSHSWWVGGGSALVLLIMSYFRPTAIPMAILFTLCWGFGGWIIGHYLIENTGASVIIAIFALLISGGLHAWALDYTLSAKETDG